MGHVKFTLLLRSTPPLVAGVLGPLQPQVTHRHLDRLPVLAHLRGIRGRRVETEPNPLSHGRASLPVRPAILLDVERNAAPDP